MNTKMIQRNPRHAFLALTASLAIALTACGGDGSTSLGALVGACLGQLPDLAPTCTQYYAPASGSEMKACTMNSGGTGSYMAGATCPAANCLGVCTDAKSRQRNFYYMGGNNKADQLKVICDNIDGGVWQTSCAQ